VKPPVRLPQRLLLYLIAVHLLAAALAIPLLAARSPWLVLAELLLLASLLTGLSLVRGQFRTLDLIRSGAQSLQERDFTTRLRPVGQAELDQLVGVYNQMVDHLREERTRLEEQQHFLGQIVRESPSGIVVLDLDGRVAEANPMAQRLLDQPALVEVMNTLEKGAAQVVALPDGRRIKCRRGGFQDRGFTRGFILLEELTEELRQVEKAAYEKLIRMMSHEVNNSVGAAGSLLHSCLTYAPLLPEEHRADLETALRVVISRTEQLGALMRSFAEVVRLPPPQPRPCRLEPLLRQVALLMRAESEQRRIAWQWPSETAPADSLVEVDPVQIEQVFLNVVKNALEAIGQDGTIVVRLARTADPGGRLQVTIQDSGAGIAPEARAQLFTPFFSTKDKGQGIGLMLIQQILTQHQCDYALEGPAGGPTRFTITFPAAGPAPLRT
jgi:two-component system, NtrC family, nitrogen regulation sensor histidine kinase NtrY